MHLICETMASQFPKQDQSPFTIGDVQTVTRNGVLIFRCTLFWNMRPVAHVDSTSGPFTPMNWEWLDESAKDDFASFLQLIRFPTADLFVGSMIATFGNIRWFAEQCKTDTLFRFPDDPPHVVQRIKKPFTPDLKEKLQAKYGTDIQVINEALEGISGPHNQLD